MGSPPALFYATSPIHSGEKSNNEVSDVSDYKCECDDKVDLDSESDTVFCQSLTWLPKMFSKKKSSKKIEISAPSNFQHRVHTGFDNHSNKFVGLPKQWASLVDDKPASQSPYRPAPMVDPMTITNPNDQENIYESRNYQNVHHNNHH